SQNATAIADGYEPKTGFTRRPKISQRINITETDASVMTHFGNGLRSTASAFAAGMDFSCLFAMSTISEPSILRGSRARLCSAARQIPACRARRQDQGGGV